MNTVMGARDLAALYYFVHAACAPTLQACGAQLRDAAMYFEAE